MKVIGYGGVVGREVIALELGSRRKGSRSWQQSRRWRNLDLSGEGKQKG